MAEGLARVAEENPDVVDAALVNPGKEVSDSGRVDLDADVVPFRAGGRRLEQGVSPAEPDLDHQGGPATEQRGGVDGGGLAARDPCFGPRSEPVARPVTFDGALLGRGDPAASQHPGADVAVAVQAIAP